MKRIIQTFAASSDPPVAASHSPSKQHAAKHMGAHKAVGSGLCPALHLIVAPALASLQMHSCPCPRHTCPSNVRKHVHAARALSAQTFKKAFHSEDVERVVGGGYEGYVAEGLDLGPTFDPVSAHAC